MLSGINYSALSYIVSRCSSNRSVVLVPNSEIDRVAGEIQSLSYKYDVFKLPHYQFFDDRDLNLLINRYQRLFTLSSIIMGGDKPIIIVSSIQGLSRMAPVPSHLKNYIIGININKTIDRESLISRLIIMGYNRTDRVMEAGDFAVRGSVIDIFPPFLKPFRINLFDDEIEGISIINPNTQLSCESLNTTWIYPLNEALYNNKSSIPSNIDIERHPYVLTQFTPIFDYLKGFDFISNDLDYQIDTLTEWLRRYSDRASLFKLYIDYNTLISQIDIKKIAENIQKNISPIQKYLGKIRMLSMDIRDYIHKGYTVIITVKSKNQQYRIRDILKGEGLSIKLIEGMKDLKASLVNIMIADVKEGFIHKDDRLVIITDEDIFGSKLCNAYADNPNLEPITHFQDIEKGDLVVHIKYGIGRYLGTTLMDVGGQRRDMIILEYAGNDRLYIPIEDIVKIQKYIGTDVVRLDSIGANRFKRAKKRAKEATQRYAKELLKLYAKRATQKGYAFSMDTIWQQELEAGFPYRETPDQIRVLNEVKRDMESPTPMDRLICGDVGFGKTEIALRAAFKAAIEGKQVALIAPTTILCLQHYRVFSERLKNFPINIAVYTRLTPTKTAQKIKQDLKGGRIDLIIGTHRLLQRDISFSDLGFLIIDEEQRFGVTHKEILRKLKQNIDTLTLTATPIPRTLSLALSGIKAISVITTPPPDRKAIKTYVLKQDITIITDAINRELERDGQVFIVHNRIETINAFAKKIQRNNPNASIRIAHGRLPKSELENILLDFLNRRFNTLITTTIIESGIDFPNANTLIVDDAQNFGLAQLHQLRGRIGRSERQAYAYFLFRNDRITPIARKRLQILATHTDLGAGFKIAMRDLEIRGAGNILGKEQSGHIEAIGFELYTIMLRDAIRELKGDASIKPPEVTINLRISAFIPPDYISDHPQKLEIYQRLAGCVKISCVDQLEGECIDRFGRPPLPVMILFDLARIRCYCYAMKINEITMERNLIKFRFSNNANININGLKNLLEKNKRARFIPGDPPILNYKLGIKEKHMAIKLVKDIISYLN